MTLSHLTVAWPEETDQAPAKDGHGGRKTCFGTALKNPTAQRTCQKTLELT